MVTGRFFSVIIMYSLWCCAINFTAKLCHFYYVSGLCDHCADEHSVLVTWLGSFTISQGVLCASDYVEIDGLCLLLVYLAGSYSAIHANCCSFPLFILPLTLVMIRYDHKIALPLKWPNGGQIFKQNLTVNGRQNGGA